MTGAQADAKACGPNLTLTSLVVLCCGGMLCACSALSPEGAQAPQRTGQPPANYRQTIADGAIDSSVNSAMTAEVAKLRNQTAAQLDEDAKKSLHPQTATAQVSSLRETRGPQLGDWMACLRVPKPGGATYISIFFEDEKILDYRTAIMFDRCEGETYGPLPPRLPSLNKEEQPQKKGSVRSERSRRL